MVTAAIPSKLPSIGPAIPSPRAFAGRGCRASSRDPAGRLIMSKMSRLPTPRCCLLASTAAGVAIAVVLLAGGAISAQDKYTVQVPDGLAFSEFRGFEDWATVAV